MECQASPRVVAALGAALLRTVASFGGGAMEELSFDPCGMGPLPDVKAAAGRRRNGRRRGKDSDAVGVAPLSCATGGKWEPIGSDFASTVGVSGRSSAGESDSAGGMDNWSGHGEGRDAAVLCGVHPTMVLSADVGLQVAFPDVAVVDCGAQTTPMVHDAAVSAALNVTNEASFLFFWAVEKFGNHMRDLGCDVSLIGDRNLTFLMGDVEDLVDLVIEHPMFKVKPKVSRGGR